MGFDNYAGWGDGEVETSVYARMGADEAERETLLRGPRPTIVVSGNSILVDGEVRYTLMQSSAGYLVTDLTDPIQPWEYPTRQQAIDSVVWYEGGTMADSV